MISRQEIGAPTLPEKTLWVACSILLTLVRCHPVTAASCLAFSPASSRNSRSPSAMEIIQRHDQIDGLVAGKPAHALTGGEAGLRCHLVLEPP